MGAVSEETSQRMCPALGSGMVDGVRQKPDHEPRAHSRASGYGYAPVLNSQPLKWQVQFQGKSRLDRGAPFIYRLSLTRPSQPNCMRSPCTKTRCHRRQLHLVSTLRILRSSFNCCDPSFPIPIRHHWLVLILHPSGVDDVEDNTLCLRTTASTHPAPLTHLPDYQI